jgi:DNA-binding NarL/FixJ family response regulator
MRVLLADGATLWRAGVARLLADAGVDVVGLVDEAGGLAEAVVRLRPDVLVVDPRMPAVREGDVLRVTAWVRRRLPGVAVLYLRGDGDTTVAVDGLGPGVGLVDKGRMSSAAELVAAVECVAMGGTVVDPGNVGRTAPGGIGRPDPLAGLSGREREVLALIAEGASNAAIAERLCIAGKTVDSHVGRILVKLGLGEDPSINRRVRAALIYLQATGRG